MSLSLLLVISWSHAHNVLLQKKKNGYSASGLGAVKEATQKTFEFLVKYCEEAK